MGYEAFTTAEIAQGKFFTTTLTTKMKDNFDYLYSAAATGTLPQNGSFEIDTDSDGVPDNWTRSLYAGGSGGLYTTAPAHGAKAIYFVHPGGASNGGGYLESSYIEVSQLEGLLLSYILWATAAGMKNEVRIRHYDKAKAYISDVALYSSTSNPTSATLYHSHFVPAATTRYIKIRLIGGFTDTDVAGTTYFDGIWLTPSFIIPSVGDSINGKHDATTSTNNTAWVLTKEFIVQRAGAFRFKFELKTSDGSSAAIGKIYRNGGAVGVQKSTASTAFQPFTDDVSGWSVGDLCQLYIRTEYVPQSCYTQNFRVCVATPCIGVTLAIL